MFSSFDRTRFLSCACLGRGRPRRSVHHFIDMHDYGDMLMAAGLADPVMDVERMTLTYGDAMQLMREIKLIGAGNASRHRARGLVRALANRRRVRHTSSSGCRRPACR